MGCNSSNWFCNSVQSLGVITRSSNNGRGIVFNQIGNNLPNIQQGYVWVGDVNSVPQPTSTGSFASGVSSLNSLLGAVTLSAGTGISVTDNGSDTITVTNTGGGADITYLNQFTASQELINSGYNTFTASADSRLNSIEAETGSYAKTNITNTFTSAQIISGALDVTNLITATSGILSNGPSTFNDQTDFSSSVFVGNSSQLVLENGTNFASEGLPAEGNFSSRTLWTLPTYTNIGARGYDVDSGAIKLYGNNTNPSVAGGYSVEFVRSGSLSTVNYFSPLSTQLLLSAASDSSKFGQVVLIDTGGDVALNLGGTNQINIGVNGFPTGQFALNNPSATIPVDIWGTQGLRVSSDPGNPKPAVHLMPDGSVSASAAISSSGDLTINNINASGTFTASLTEGYVWAGGAGNVTQLVATSSFGGGGGGIFEQTGSFYATTNDLQVTGSFGVQGAIGGNSETLTITSLTASIDLTTSNTYELTLVSSADTHVDVSTFGESGQSINILVKQPASGNTGSISFSPDFKFGQGYNYSPTPSNSAEDIVSFLVVDSSLYGTYINNFS